MTALAQVLVAALLVIGGGFALVGAWGLVRLPDAMTRLHGPVQPGHRVGQPHQPPGADQREAAPDDEKRRHENLRQRRHSMMSPLSRNLAKPTVAMKPTMANSIAAAMLFAMVGFIATVGFAKFLLRGDIIE